MTTKHLKRTFRRSGLSSIKHDKVHRNSSQTETKNTRRFAGQPDCDAKICVCGETIITFKVKSHNQLLETQNPKENEIERYTIVFTVVIF